MNSLPPWLSRLIEDTSGQDMVEYGLILVFVTLAAIAGLRNLQNTLTQVPNAILYQFFHLMGYI